VSDYWNQYEGKSVPLKELLKWLSDEHSHVTDDEGEPLEGWNHPVVNSMALHRWAIDKAAPVEYEYGIQYFDNIGQKWIVIGEWFGYGLNFFTTIEDREEYIDELQIDYVDTTFMLVKRRKAGPVEEA